MSDLLSAINRENTKTLNGMATLSSSLDHAVDLFYGIGSSRGKDIVPLFSKAFSVEKELAVRIALWARDIRGGAGERQTYRDILSYLVVRDQELCKKIMNKTVEVGRWDDILVFMDTALEINALRFIAKSLKSGDSLCAKWMPRKGKNANKIRSYLKITPKEYRKLLSGLSKTIENNLCSKNFDGVDFSELPSLASIRYQSAFMRNASEKYVAFKSELISGNTTINASAVYPYDIIKALQYGADVNVASCQWSSLPDYMAGSTENVLVLVDVSDSMLCSAGNNITCKDVAVSLGLYISERTRGIFKDNFITFSEKPTLEVVDGSLYDRYIQMSCSEWGGSTNLAMALDLILCAATKHGVSAHDMPTKLLVLSDMQFNIADDSSDTAFDMIKRKYSETNYKMPSIVFWNINSPVGVPTEFNDRGAALVSGFSPSIMRSVLASTETDITPMNIMLDAVMVDRYDF